MLRAILLAGMAATAAVLGVYLYSSQHKDSFSMSHFAQFASEHGKTYSSQAEFDYRYEIFLNNKEFAEEVNKRQSSFTAGINVFSDLTFEEFKEKYLSKEVIANKVFRNPSAKLIKASKDWREERKVSAVKNQGMCGSCWAFSTIASLESAFAIKSGKDITNLSEQELVDCSGEYGNQGCNGGLMNQAFDYIKDHKIATGTDYPYIGKDAKCHRKDTGDRFTIVEYKVIEPVDVSGLMNALEVGPVSVAIEVQRDFQAYKGGVYKNENCGQSLNHGVAAVGYKNEDDEDNQYFIVKNSWSEKWGEKGFVRMFIGSGSGTCGIANESDVYPIV